MRLGSEINRVKATLKDLHTQELKTGFIIFTRNESIVEVETENKIYSFNSFDELFDHFTFNFNNGQKQYNKLQKLIIKLFKL